MDPYVIIPLEIKRPLTFPVKSAHKQPSYSRWDNRHDVENMSFSQFLSTNQKKLTKSTVGHMGKNIIDENARKSHVIENVKISINLDHHFNKELEEQIKKIVPVYFRNQSFSSVLEMDDSDEDQSESRKWDLVIYDPKDKFVKHTDGKKDETHYGTLLLFPPDVINDFVGGELVIYQSGKELHRIKPQTFDKWTLVAFPVNVEHECLPIISGTRYVFKSKLHLSMTYIKLYGITEHSQPVKVSFDDIDPEIQLHKKKIAEYEKKINDIKSTIEQLSKLLPSNESLDIVEKIKVDDSLSFIIVLDRYYNELDPNYLIGEDRLLYNCIVDVYPQTKLSHINDVKHNLGDGCDNARDELYLDDEVGLSLIIYQKNIEKGKTPGDVTNQESEYNDSTYDNIATTNITVIVGHKIN